MPLKIVVYHPFIIDTTTGCCSDSCAKDNSPYNVSAADSVHLFQNLEKFSHIGGNHSCFSLPVTFAVHKVNMAKQCERPMRILNETEIVALRELLLLSL